MLCICAILAIVFARVLAITLMAGWRFSFTLPVRTTALVSALASFFFFAGIRFGARGASVTDMGHFINEPNRRLVPIEMTDERKERIGAMVTQIVPILTSGSQDMMEIFITLEFIKRSFERTAGVKYNGGTILTGDDLAEFDKQGN